MNRVGSRAYSPIVSIRALVARFFTGPCLGLLPLLVIARCLHYSVRICFAEGRGAPVSLRLWLRLLALFTPPLAPSLRHSYRFWLYADEVENDAGDVKCATQTKAALSHP